MSTAFAVIQSSWVQIIVATVMVAMFIFGYKKGLVKMSVSFVSIILSTVITKMSLPYVKGYVLKNDRLRLMLQGKVHSIITDGMNSRSYAGAGTGAAADSAGKSSADLFYQMIGLDKVTEYIGEKVTDLILTVILFILLMILVNLLVRLLFKLLDLLVQAPVLSFINRMLGGTLGLIESCFYIWTAILVIGLLPANVFTENIAMQFNMPGTWLNYLKS